MITYFSVLALMQWLSPVHSSLFGTNSIYNMYISVVADVVLETTVTSFSEKERKREFKVNPVKILNKMLQIV
jgi:hypothetical protein